jgi:hypothetical protein
MRLRLSVCNFDPGTKACAVIDVGDNEMRQVRTAYRERIA